MKIYAVEVLGSKGEVLKRVSPFCNKEKAMEEGRNQKVRIPSAKVKIISGDDLEEWIIDIVDSDHEDL